MITRFGCIGGYAAYTPPNLGTPTAIPKDPEKVNCPVDRNKNGVTHLLADHTAENP